MIMKNVLRFLTGSVKYRVSCFDSARISALLMKKFSSRIIDTKIIDDNSFEYTCISFFQGSIKAFLKSYCNECIKIKNYGILALFDMILKRPGLALGIVLSLILCYAQSIPVWEIIVTGNSSISDKEIIEGLDEVGFRVGGAKNNDMLYEYSNMYIMNDSRISRMSINMSGNIAFVEVGERTEKPADTTPTSMTGLFSKRNCIIELPIAESGKSVVKAGDSVYEGQMVISPIIKGDNDVEYIVGAKGKVYARTRDCFTVSIPLVNKSASCIGEGIGKITVTFLGKDFCIPSLKQQNNKVYFKDKKEKLKLFGKIELPVYITKRQQYSYEENEIILTKEEAQKLAYEKMYSFISDEKGDCEILSTSFEESIDENAFTLKCTLESVEDVVKPDF